MDALFEVKAVVFDNDGTLVDSMPGITRAFGQLIEEHSADPASMGDFHGRSSADIIRAVVGSAAADEAISRIELLEIEHAFDTSPHPGVLDALAALPAERVAVASSGTTKVVNARLQAAGIQTPRVVVSSDDVERAKPAPDIFLAACERLGFEPQDCLVVEDSVAGVQAGKAAGCPVLAVLTTTPRDPLAAAGADAIVSNLAELDFTVHDGLVKVTAKH